MVVSSINTYKASNNTQINFCAKTRSERSAEKDYYYSDAYAEVVHERSLKDLEIAKKEIERRRKARKAREEREEREEREIKYNEEKQYREDVKELKETQGIIKDLTRSSKKLFAGNSLQKVGDIADIAISATLSGMALHWSTGHAYKKLHEVAKKPKVAKVIKNIKRPFQIVGSSLAEGLKTTWNTFAKKVKETKNGQKLLATKPMQKINKAIDEIGESYKNFKTDVKNLTPENIKSGVATTFGVSGATATVVDKLDENPRNKD